MTSIPSHQIPRLARVRPLLASFCLVIGTAPYASAQTASSNSSEEIIMLGAFEVNASEDVGYQAGNTTSGSRLNSSLKDTAAAVMAFTPEFMEDFGITNLEEMTAYSANMAVDMLDTSADANPQFVGGADLNDSRIRVRGLSASTSRDFFETQIRIDSYNTERVELSSGPNSILFGFGSPGGLVNVMTKRAQLNRNRTNVKAQFGSWDFSRYELDHNQILIPGKVALRVNGMTTDSNGWRKWDWNDSTRGTASLRVTPTKNTVFNATFEKGEFNAHVTRPMNAFDNAQLWFDAGSLTMSDAQWNGGQRANGINRFGGVRVFYNTTADGSVEPYVITTRNANNNRLLVTTYDNFSVPSLERAGATLAPESLIPYDISTYGPGSERHSEFDRFSAVIEQRLTDDIVIELAYSRENTEQQVNTSQGGNLTINGDPNTTIPNPDGSGNAVANPHAGDLFIESRWAGDEGATGTDIFRAALAWDLKTEKFGRHKMAVMAEHGEIEAWRYPKAEILVDENGVAINNANAPQNNLNWVWRRQYITPGDYDTYYGGNSNDNFTVERNGKTYRNVTINSSTAGGWLERTMDSMMAVTQSYFWDDRIIATAGVRKDNITFDNHGESTYAADDPAVLAGNAIPREPVFTDDIVSSTDFNPTTYTGGLVFHATPMFSVFVNHSNNTAAPRQNFRILPDETLPEPVEGETLDYGFMLDLLDGKLFIRATAYETEQLKSVGGSFAIGLEATGNNIAAPATRILDTLLANNIITENEYADHIVGENVNLSGSSDIVNSGYELSAWFNLSENFTAVANFAYTETDRSSIVPEFEPWFERENAFWLQSPGAGSLVNEDSELTIDQEVTTILATMESIREFYGVGYGVRPYSANVNGRYSFKDGALKGLFVGGGARWQSTSDLGREFLGRTAEGSRILGDVIKGPEDFKVDAFLGYRTKAKWLGDKTELTLQLNITNLTDEDTVVPLRYNQGETGYLRVLLREPRRYRVTFGLAF